MTDARKQWPFELIINTTDGKQVSWNFSTAKAARLHAKRYVGHKGVKRVTLVDPMPWGAMPVVLWET